MAERCVAGDFQITRILAGIYHWDGGVMFGVVPRALWSRHFTPDDLNRIPLAFNCYLIETGEHTVLVETGGGDKMPAKAWARMALPGPMPPLPEILAGQGIDPESIDIVINSHLHWDHCSGNTVLCNGIPRAALPRATYYARRGEWEHAHRRHPRDTISYFDDNYDPLIDSGRMTLLDGDGEIVPGVRVECAPGHNRDMMIVRAGPFCFFSDLIPTVAHLTATWVTAFDLYPLESIDNKTRILAQAAAEGWICGFGHDVEVAFRQITKS